MGAHQPGGSFREGAYALGIAVMGVLSFPPFGLWPLSVVAICLFLLLIRDADTPTARNLGLIYGFCYGLGVLYWFFGIFYEMTLLLILLFAVYVCLFSILVGLTRGQNPFLRALLVGVFAVGIEWLRGDAWYLRFPWYTVPHALAQQPNWIAPVRWLGTYGFSFVIWFLAAAGAFSNWKIWLAFLLLPACAFLLPEVTAPDQRVLLLQTEEGDGGVSLIRALSTSSTENVQLAVLPEYAFHSSAETALRFRDGPADLAGKCRCPVVFGATEEVAKSSDYYNVAAVIDERGHILDTFPKQRPVPLFKDGLPGTRCPVIPIEDHVLGVAVCFDFDAPEVAATLVNRGATVLVAPTCDVMSWGRMQHIDHELLTRLRAVENDRWILRCASSGRSEVINPHGKPSTEGVEIGETGTVIVAFAHQEDVPLGSRLSFLGPAAAAGMLLFLVVNGVRRIWKWL